MGNVFNHLITVMTANGFEVLTTTEPGIFLIQDQGETVAILRDHEFRWFAP